ncbi:carbohydrate:proton symporter [Malassezia pachydermatis]|uniref:Sugar transporter stl1 n=1 Tax=Malassezia pachydermatis TaxID=77020 RepID=A0A0M8MJT3_9BASI|nr:sugar transporter stl1 [Malassezia pachydermatis]KOS13906.1 sugar transporter stl1 [Malassezia pachydermatis]
MATFGQSSSAKADNATAKDHTVYANGKSHDTFIGLSGSRLNIMIAVTAGVGFTLFGYDQGVMGSLLTLPSFLQQFPTMNGATHPTLQGATVGIYEIGCFAGAVSCLIWGNAFGRRAMIWIGSIFMAVGTIIQCIGEHVAMLWVGRIITGIGNGQHTSTIPVWQSECSPPHRRGMLIMIEGSLIALGIMISYWVDFALFWADSAKGFSPLQEGYVKATSIDTVSWRFPIAFQLLLILPTFLTIWMPESPRWLLLRGREEDARKVLSALHERPRHDPIIDTLVDEINEGLALSKDVRFRDLLKQGKSHNFHRTVLGFVVQMFQQITGINLITYYAGTIFQNNMGMTDVTARILAACNGTEYFLASLVAIFTIEKFGRRKLMIFGALGQAFTMAVLTGLLSRTALQWDPKPIDEEMCSFYRQGRINESIWCEQVPGKARRDGYAVGGVVMLFVFNTFFAIGWLGMTWLYPAECTPLSIRAQANGISTSANWLFNFLVVMITPIAFANINNYTYLIFCVINLLMAPASWWIFPETAGRSLEEMDEIFARSSVWNPYDVVRIEKTFPRRYDQHGHLKLEYIEEHQHFHGVDTSLKPAPSPENI